MPMEKNSKKTTEGKGKKPIKTSTNARGRKRKINPDNQNEIDNVDKREDTRSSNDPNHDTQEAITKDPLCFKNPKYRENGFVIQTRIWKNLKQIMNTQKSQSLPGEITYASIDAPASMKPKKKYSDLSGLPALYTDPHTKLRYANSDEYRQIQHLSSDTVTGLLALRKAQT
uniref:INO80 complex subunit C n=1 Tax=Phallusia mammillata TaxID=59560 RepID=A0A6F9DEG9_9ASCI|nr:INO80 complex subunit C [Phallusia mammillata]